MFRIISLLLLMFILRIECKGELVSYNKFKIIEITGRNQFSNDEEIFNHFGIPLDENSELLHEDAATNTMQILLQPENVDSVLQKLEAEEFQYEIIDEDLGMSISLVELTRLNADKLNGTAVFDKYMDADEITSYLENIARQNPDKVRVVDIGKSVEGQDIKMAIISDRIRRSNKTPSKDIIFVEAAFPIREEFLLPSARLPVKVVAVPWGFNPLQHSYAVTWVTSPTLGIHAREWISHSSALYLIENLLTTPSMLKDFEWRIVPITNPDGYRYTWTTNRMWRKNRQVPIANSPVKGPCYGVDLNRNFDAFWNTQGTNQRSCSAVYAGKTAFSEPEALAIKNTIEAVNDRMKAYISIHSYGQYILYPPGVTAYAMPAKRTSTLDHVAMRMAEAIANATSTNYTYGAPAKLLYAASGLSMDWAYTKANVPLAYTFEMRDQGNNGFILHPSKIESAVKDFWSAMKLLVEEIPLLRAVVAE